MDNDVHVTVGLMEAPHDVTVTVKGCDVGPINIVGIPRAVVRW